MLFNHPKIPSNNFTFKGYDIIPEAVALLAWIKRIITLSVGKAITPEVADVSTS